MPECQPDHYIRTTQEINSGNIEAIILSPTFADKVAAKRAKKKKCRIKEREIKEIKKSALCCFGTLYRTRGCFWNHAYLYKAAVINEDCECYWFAGAYTCILPCVLSEHRLRKTPKIKIRSDFWGRVWVLSVFLFLLLCCLNSQCFAVGLLGIWIMRSISVMPIKFIQCQTRTYCRK